MCEACTTLEKALPSFSSMFEQFYAQTGQPEGVLWQRNDQWDAWADLEDAYYLEISEGTIAVVTNLMEHMGLGAPDVLHLEKAIKIDLIKAKGDGALDRFKYLPKSVIKFLTDGKPWTQKQLTEIEKLLGRGLSGLRTITDKYMVKAGALSALMEAFDAANRPLPRLLVQDLPVTIDARKHLPAPVAGQEYRLRADKGAPAQPVLPMTTLEEEAIAWAQLHAGEKIATQSDFVKAQVKELVIKARQGRWTPRELQQALLHKLGEFNRDWRRIAITELADCMSNGYIATLREGDYVVGQSDGTACEWCKEHIHGKVFRVVKTPGNPMVEVWVGKTNYGRKKAQWIPAIPAHPNCRCRWQKFDPKFTKIDPITGRVVPKTREEILAERKMIKSFFGRYALIKSYGAPTAAQLDQIVGRSTWEWRDPHTLGANPNQVPMLDPEKLERMRKVFAKYGPMDPILIDRNGTILDGHHRWYVACEFDWPWVPVIVAPVRVAQAIDEAGPDPDVGALAKAELHE